MLLVIDQHPDKIFCMVFYDANYTISPNSKTTYADWCDKHLIPWHDTKKGKDLNFPKEWFD